MASPLNIKKVSQHLITHSGIALAGHLISTDAFNADLDALSYGKRSPFSNSDIVKSLAGVICVGKPNFEAITEFKDDNFFCYGMDIQEVPSPETLRQRFDEYGDDLKELVKKHSIKMVKIHDSSLSSCFKGYVPLDIDVSPFDNSGTKKEGISCTYKFFDGYAPIFAYLGQNEGYLINLELREGSQHCQKNTPEFLDQSIKNSIEITDQPILVRLDGGNDSKDNLDVCKKNKVDWVIKRNPRKEKQTWIDLALSRSNGVEVREGKIVYRGFTEEFIDNERYVTAYEVTERTVLSDGQTLLFPDYDVDLYWTSLEHSDVEDIVKIYHSHGTSEQFHSELKTDLDLERLPSGKFKTNELFLTVGGMVYNALRLIGQKSIVLDGDLPPEERMPTKKRVKRRRIRSVMQDIIYFAGSFSERARSFTISMWSKNPWLPIFEKLSLHFGLLRT